MLRLRIKYHFGTITCSLSATETSASTNRSLGKLKGKGHSCIGIVRLSSDVVYSINMVCVGSSCLFFFSPQGDEVHKCTHQYGINTN